MILRPFFPYFGSKWRAGAGYPKPEHNTLVEPFAGSAAYALRHPERSVLLTDRDPILAGVWDFLIHASERDISSLPALFASTDDLHCAQEAKWLIGFWLNKGSSSPCKTPGAWMRSQPEVGTNYWGEGAKRRIISQQPSIRHWQVSCSSYEDVPDLEATWFIDPPYQVAGKSYTHSSVDYPGLAAWVRSREGQVIVCENEGATWLPFTPFRDVKATAGRARAGVSKEVVYLSHNPPTCLYCGDKHSMPRDGRCLI